MKRDKGQLQKKVGLRAVESCWDCGTVRSRKQSTYWALWALEHLRGQGGDTVGARGRGARRVLAASQKGNLGLALPHPSFFVLPVPPRPVLHLIRMW